MSNKPAAIVNIGATLANGEVVVIHRSFPQSPECLQAISCPHVEPIENARAGGPQAIVSLLGTNTGKNLGQHAVQESADEIRALFSEAGVTAPVRRQPVGPIGVVVKAFAQKCGLVL